MKRWGISKHKTQQREQPTYRCSALIGETTINTSVWWNDLRTYVPRRILQEMARHGQIRRTVPIPTKSGDSKQEIVGCSLLARGRCLSAGVGNRRPNCGPPRIWFGPSKYMYIFFCLLLFWNRKLGMVSGALDSSENRIRPTSQLWGVAIICQWKRDIAKKYFMQRPRPLPLAAYTIYTHFSIDSIVELYLK